VVIFYVDYHRKITLGTYPGLMVLHPTVRWFRVCSHLSLRLNLGRYVIPVLSI